MAGSRRPGTIVSKLVGFVLWLVATAAGGAALAVTAGLVLDHSLGLTRRAVTVLVALVLGLVLAILHRRATGNPALLFLMRVVLGLLCLAILVMAWSLSSTPEGEGTTTTFFNNSDRKIHVKVNRIAPSGVMGDEAYTFTLAPGAESDFLFAKLQRGTSYSVVMSSYRGRHSWTAGRSSGRARLGRLFESGGVGEPFHRRIFAASEAPATIVVVLRDGKLAVGEDAGDPDPYAIPRPATSAGSP